MNRKSVENSYITFNTEYLEEVIFKSQLSQRDFSLSIGMGMSFISDCKARGSMRKNQLQLICKLYDADYEKMITLPKPKPAPVVEPIAEESKPATDSAIIYRKIAKLELRIDALENAKQEPKKQEDDELTKREKVILLLKQMTMYGGCEESDFRTKAMNCGFDTAHIQFAINYLKCTIDTRGKYRWIIRK